MTRRLRGDLAGKRALVTGASSGIGRALAVELARRGASVVCLARRAEELAQTAALVENEGALAVPVVGDVTDATYRAATLAAAVSRLGGLDLLINNAGVSAHGRFHESSVDRLRQIVEVNLFAAAELIHAATPLLKQGRDPAVVNIGSILGWRGVPHNAEYCASKFALRGFSEAIRPELSRIGVHVLHVSPGTVATPFFDHLIEKQAELPWAARRGESPGRVARLTLDAVARRRKELTIGVGGWWLVQTARHAPWLLDLVMRRYG
ncbi:SDR family NAD(P)-dependent oxidoreductase [Botrimarina hoheduenensis]|uniref:General stress protein 39 n=1 Tax=Botrimarina hoheduenensis TaxID=2528000 RepID=A0A5C5WCS0_9BACT|nr:SDR family NAD(P)-dependent oxidoreductase [Botrimarina hoheduenensis]TWT48464.1 General stress protein 39 [Botrimarina hoheduenensis]